MFLNVLLLTGLSLIGIFVCSCHYSQICHIHARLSLEFNTVSVVPYYCPYHYRVFARLVVVVVVVA